MAQIVMTIVLFLITGGILLLTIYTGWRRKYARIRASFGLSLALGIWLSALLPLLANALYLRFSPPGALDPTPFAIAVSLGLLLLNLLRFRLLDVVPRARDAVVAVLPDGIIVLDAQQRIVEANTAAVRLLGQPLHAMIGQPLHEFTAAITELTALCNVANEAHIDVEHRSGGDTRTLELSMVTLSQHDKRCAGWVVSVRDRTSHTRAERAQRFLSEASASLATSIDLDTTLQRVAELAVPTLGDWCVVTLGETVIGSRSVFRTIAPLQLRKQVEVCWQAQSPVHGQVPNIMQRLFIPAIAADDPAAGTEEWRMLNELLGIRSYMRVPLVARDRTFGAITVWTTESLRHYSDDDRELAEELARRAALAIDSAELFTEGQRTNAALEHARAAAELEAHARARFLATMSHEIRTPMNGMLGLAGLLAETPLDAEQREMVDIIRSSGTALMTIVNDVLDIAKIESGHIDFALEPFDVQACVESSLEPVLLRAAEKRLSVHCTIDSSVPTRLIGDAGRLRQILVNLLSNAVKWTEVGEIDVSVSAHCTTDQQYNVLFCVRDTGVGIAPEQISNLFIPFSQLGSHHKGEGTGLGLSIGKHLCELMGGSMSVASEPGVGSLFSFTILAKAAAPDTNTIAPETRFAGTRVLIADGNMASRVTLEQQTRRWGMHVSATSDAAEALALIGQGERFDIALIDATLRLADETPLVAAVRAQHMPETLPILLLSDFGSRDTMLHVQAALLRPIRLTQLRANLTQVLDSKFAATIMQHNQNTSDPLSILIVDDDPVSRRLLTVLLEQLGHHTTVHNTGSAALAAIAGQHYDIVMVDLHLPDIDGLAIARQLGAMNERPYLIAATASVSQRTRELAKAAGFDDYLVKPLRKEVIYAALARASRNGQADSFADQVQQALNEPALDALYHAIGSERHVLDEIVANYIADANILIDDMRVAASRSDIRSIRRAAHKLKSSSATLAALQLAALCHDLERAAKAAAIDVCRSLILEIDHEYSRVRRALRSQDVGTWRHAPDGVEAKRMTDIAESG